MGAFWGVAQGSDEPPALIIMRYEPADAPATPVLGLVGKGVTFDTGGISIKPADGMEKMKYDMAGAAAMIGAMRGIALLKPKVRVTAIICATENMPSGKAQKPGDIQIAMSGKSIEIINTDAEGRLVLADGLCYARQLGCTHLIDAATLTGAVVVALGYVNAGVFANDEKMYERFSRALEKAGEKFWRLPLDDEYKENIRSNIADIVNSGGRWGGAVNAAMFLKEFAEDTPWLHLDIAGTAWMEENKPWIAKGSVGNCGAKPGGVRQRIQQLDIPKLWRRATRPSRPGKRSHIAAGTQIPITAKARISSRRTTATVANRNLFRPFIRLSKYGMPVIERIEKLCQLEHVLG